jgi:hypothetical protein
LIAKGQALEESKQNQKKAVVNSRNEQHIVKIVNIDFKQIWVSETYGRN